MKKLSKLHGWIDTHLLQIMMSVYIFLIPLYPKFPIKMVNFTYIAIRAEDFYMVAFVLVYMIQLLRKKATVNRYFLIPFLVFWLAMFTSFVYGFYVSKTIAVRNLGFLNAARRVEYMSVFFIAVSLIKSKRDFFYYLGLNIFVFFLVMVYGIGQKFIGWPAVQTMNPEYAKGYLLFLTPDARVSSTFAGQYDLGAYIVFFTPIIAAYYFLKKNLYYFGIIILAIFVLMLTASRASFGSFIVSFFPLLLVMKKPKSAIILAVITIIFALTSNQLTSRLQRTFMVKQIFVNQFTGQVVVPQTITSKQVPAGTFYVGGTKATGPVNESLLQQNLVSNITDQAKQKGQKISTAEAEQLAASMAANLKPIKTVVSDISFATRLQVEWPRAIHAFLKNPVFGAGPSAITEATDNDFLRNLGEFGLFGFLSLGFILFLFVKKIWGILQKVQIDEQYLMLAFLFGMFGLLVNGIYIDVLEASKDAFFFWMIAGFYMGTVRIVTLTAKNHEKKRK